MQLTDVFGYYLAMKAELEIFRSEGKQNARRAVWQGIFLLPAIAFWLFGYALPLPVALAGGAIGYLILSALFAIILRRVQTPEEKAIEMLQQTVNDLSERLDVENGYYGVLGALATAEERQNAYLMWKHSGEDPSSMPMGSQNTLNQLTSTVSEFREKMSRILAQRTGNAVAPVPTAELEVGDVEGLHRLRSALHDEMTLFRIAG